MKKLSLIFIIMLLVFPVKSAFAAPVMIADNTGTPSVYNNRIVYKDMNANWQIKMLDLNTSTTYNITNDANNYEWPKIYDDKVIYHQMEWVGENYSNSDIKLAYIAEDPSNPPSVDNLAEPNAKATFTWLSDIHGNYIFYHSSNANLPNGWPSNYWRYNIISSTSEWGEAWNFDDISAYGNSSLVYSNDSHTGLYYFVQEPVDFDQLLGPLAQVNAPASLRWPVCSGNDYFAVYSDGTNYSIWRGNTVSGRFGEVHTPSPSTRPIRHLDFQGDKLVWEETVGASHWQSFYEAQDMVAPSVTITSPPSGKYIRGRTRISATASDSSGIDYARLIEGSTTLQTIVSSGPFNFTYNTATKSNGAHTIKVKAYDNFMVGYRTRVVRVDNYKPRTTGTRNASVRKYRRVRLYYRVNDSYTDKAYVTLKIKKGTRLKKTIRLGWVPKNRLRYYTYRARLARGRYKYYVYARDRAGNNQYNVKNAYLVIKQCLVPSDSWLVADWKLIFSRFCSSG